MSKFFMPCSMLTIFCLYMSPLKASTHPYEQLTGLKRFDKTSTLHAAIHSKAIDIKGVKIGDNILKQAIALKAKGGELGRIRGGYRSDKIKFSFFQPYQGSRLEQRLDLSFDKNNGFIQQISTTYSLGDAYMDISSLREQTLQASIKKYGEPITMEQAYAVSQQKSGDIKLSKWIDALQQGQPQLPPQALNFLQKLNIARNSKITAGKNNYALIHSGFNRCHLWQVDTFKQILTFCFFDDSGGNMNGRGVELSLVNFTIMKQIQDFNKGNQQSGISL